MLNPRQIEVGYFKDKKHPYRMKCYYPVIGRVVRRKPYRTASEANARAAAVFGRWCRLYDAAILARITSSSPVAAEEEQVVRVEG